MAAALQVHPLELLKPYFNSYVADGNNACKTPGMGSGFIADVTYPDYSLVYTQQVF